MVVHTRTVPASGSDRSEIVKPPQIAVVVARVDERLRGMRAAGAEFVPGEERDLIAAEQRWAKEQIDGLTQRQAQRWIAERLGRQPLTFCRGKRERSISAATAEAFGFKERRVPLAMPDGCGRIFDDPPTRLQTLYCPACRKTETARQRAFEADFRAVILAERSRPVGELFPTIRSIWSLDVGWSYRRTCSCGAIHFPKRPDETWCPSCRAAKRVRPSPD